MENNQVRPNKASPTTQANAAPKKPRRFRAKHKPGSAPAVSLPSAGTMMTHTVTIERPFGASFGNQGDACAASNILEGGNADRAGILSGDTIEQVDDQTWTPTFHRVATYLKQLPKRTPCTIRFSRALTGVGANLRATITGAFNMYDGFTLFQILASHSAGSWCVYKRFSDFEGLHTDLAKLRLPVNELASASSRALMWVRASFQRNDCSARWTKTECASEWYET
eukprot:TRINITY_DN7939_c0_g1_i1.p1 TRINITY_DN7939_c0_g1~~TRINITY_DN7939_c0_g1_i1.p1  ORF type:complete len:225 (+),score=17.03 TRINITY_DN7939_c0_g1_i1:3-677(+)